MIFAAGLGTRLKPITESCPKALVEVEGVPLLERVIARLKRYGYTEIIVNVHHFADQVIDFIESKKRFGITIEISDERDLLLDTGGGLKAAGWFLRGKDPFLVHNVDILSNIDLDDFRTVHQHSNALVTLAVSQRKTSRVLLFNHNGMLSAWKNLKNDDTKWARLSQEPLRMCSFSGVHMVDPRFFDHVHEEGRFPIIDTYLKLAADHEIHAYYHDADLWMDVGKHESLEAAADLLKKIERHTVENGSTAISSASR